ncbi:DUF2309 domain-containing protein [Nitrosomonas nitrosa]|uniref:DUF2309 domain-containing protein n=1 Tax=Nitrosomonas nitrosa TaxID=52442 RepID=UPI0023F96D66|nr:DUF2309 domain-containing protein [Nitrosomonas nitrosa]MCO6435121.1 DUF2309 domain-containing protein [Nitrosomonas nitrosa]
MEPKTEFCSDREQVLAALNHLDHVLPGQAPILDFVHHNTLHGYQYLSFEEALAESEKMTGICGYLPEVQSRNFYWQGRINDQDIDAELAKNSKLQSEQIIYQSTKLAIKRKDIYKIALLYDLQPITVSQLNWQIEEMDALTAVQGDVPEQVRKRLLAAGGDPAQIIRQLWESILSKLGLEQADLHPENMLDLSIEQAKDWMAKISASHADSGGMSVHQMMRQEASARFDEMLSQIGDSITLRGFVMALSGIDILFSVRPQLIRICASALDEGVAPWQLPERKKLGLYAAWRAAAHYDINPFLHDLSDWQQIVTELPEDPVDCIIAQLTRFEIPQDKWEGYLRRLALELPGWSGIINWRQHHPKYYAENDAAPKLADYLAIRLTLDRLWLNQACRDTWGIEARLGAIKYYFNKSLSEFMVRRLLYLGELPEYLTHPAKALITRSGSERHNQVEWQQLADLLWTWQFSPMSESSIEHHAFNSGWRLFRLCQHLGVDGLHIQQMHNDVLLQMLSVLDEFDITERYKIWLYAYERNYREAFFQAIRANHNRGRWAKRDSRPDAQLVFCIDDREESFRRHLEELNPNIETLGAAGFFGVPMNYKGLDDTKVTPLCPVVVTPAHEVQEVPRTGGEQALSSHRSGRKIVEWTNNWLHQRLRRHLFIAQPVIDVIAPVALVGLLAKAVFPKRQNEWMTLLRKRVSPDVKTQLNFTSTDQENIASPENPKLGFTDNEQADLVAAFLRNTGLTYGFSELVLLVGHGSISQNNPHLAAYDCGACSGRHGGPNARLFAAMANRPEIRRLVTERGIDIPEDTWFIGTEHNTCNEEIIWYDLDDVPEERYVALQKLQQELRHIQKMSAHERCRRLASAPRNPTPDRALIHIEERARDFSQARPELGHATNASAIVGRRSITQGAFFDRRAFLISYDPTQDPEGKILEGILLAVGPVGAGINLEYYFSTVNNERFGCGTKVPHNVVGFFGIMEGTSSDLRTGLPRQMIEIHEAVRLLVLIEAKIEIVGQIYERQASLRELIGGGWILVATKDPESEVIHFFERGVGFVQWEGDVSDLPIFDRSPDCYRDKTVPVPPVLIKQPELQGI